VFLPFRKCFYSTRNHITKHSDVKIKYYSFTNKKPGTHTNLKILSNTCEWNKLNVQVFIFDNLVIYLLFSLEKTVYFLKNKSVLTSARHNIMRITSSALSSWRLHWLPKITWPKSRKILQTPMFKICVPSYFRVSKARPELNK